MHGRVVCSGALCVIGDWSILVQGPVVGRRAQGKACDTLLAILVRGVVVSGGQSESSLDVVSEDGRLRGKDRPAGCRSLFLLC